VIRAMVVRLRAGRGGKRTLLQREPSHFLVRDLRNETGFRTSKQLRP
jgi:hypothetical protein